MQTSSSEYIPWARPALVGREAELVQQALSSTWISGGPFVEEFEAALKAITGGKFVSATSNGTAAIELAFMALGVAPGDEIVAPAFGYMAAANVARRYGVDVKFADVDPKTWCVTQDSVQAAITGKTKCVVPIHTYGAMADTSSLVNLCLDANISVIEDAAEALGSRRAGVAAGTTAVAGTLSFQATKTIATGEGGAVITRDEELNEMVRLYRSHGTKEKKYLHLVPGANFRLTNMQAALGMAQLEKAHYLMSERNRIHACYRDSLSLLPELILQHFDSESRPVVWATGVQLPEEFSEAERDEIIFLLREKYQIETRPGFYGPNSHSYFERSYNPVAERLSASIIVLPGFVEMRDSEIQRVIESLDFAIQTIRNERRRR
jgi:perosamine synthetase